MERLFRKNFWAINLAFIAMVALLAAGTVNVSMESVIAPQSMPRGRIVARASPAVAPTPLDLERLAGMVGLPLPLDREPVKSDLRARLLGTLLSGTNEWSFASIQDAVTRRASTFMVGTVIQGALILDIERTRVIVLNNGRREFIDGESVIRPSDAPPAQVVTGSGIRAIDDSHYEIPRAEIDRPLSNLNDAAMWARIVPAFKDGVAQGFKLFSIRPDSLYAKIGIQNGDVIRRINGFDLDSPEKVLEIYSKLKEANRIDIELERNGAVLQKTYDIR